MTSLNRAAVFVLCALLALGALAYSGAPQAGQADDIARLLAGLPPSGARFGRSEDGALRGYSRDVSNSWAQYESRFGSALRKWACAELDPVDGGTVFYPFSGPDFPTLFELFPDAGRHVLVSIQKAEAPPALETLSSPELERYLAAIRKAWIFFGNSGFFKSDDLDAVEKVQGYGLGVTGPLMALAVRLGFELEAVSPLERDPDRRDVIVGSPYGDKAWDSVRLSLRKGSRRVIVDYVQMDLSDAWLVQVPADQRWLARMASHPTLLKAASHHLQEADFSMLRETLLKNAPVIVQDETGLDFNALADAFPVVRLYGRFTRPHHSFDQGFQRTLVVAYAKSGSLRPLPLRFGYEKAAGSAVQVAVRDPASAPGTRTCGPATKGARPAPPKGRRAD